MFVFQFVLRLDRNLKWTTNKVLTVVWKSESTPTFYVRNILHYFLFFSYSHGSYSRDNFAGRAAANSLMTLLVCFSWPENCQEKVHNSVLDQPSSQPNHPPSTTFALSLRLYPNLVLKVATLSPYTLSQAQVSLSLFHPIKGYILFKVLCIQCNSCNYPLKQELLWHKIWLFYIFRSEMIIKQYLYKWTEFGNQKMETFFVKQNKNKQHPNVTILKEEKMPFTENIEICQVNITLFERLSWLRAQLIWLTASLQHGQFACIPQKQKRN